MKKVFTVLAGLAIVASGVLTSGCRSTKLEEGLRDGYPAARRMPGRDLEVVWDSPDAEWGGLDESMLSGDMEIAAGRERRWEGVAVYFAFDRSTVGASERPKVESLAEFLSANPNFYVVVEGHCDERGSEEYNRGLGERRALAVKDYLRTLGIDESRIHTLSYGIERPAIPGAATEAEHAKNRRCEFILGRE